jgi:hypothetical protein
MIDWEHRLWAPWGIPGGRGGGGILAFCMVCGISTRQLDTAAESRGEQSNRPDASQQGVAVVSAVS